MGLYFAFLKRFPEITLFISIPLILLIGQTPITEYIALFKFMVYFLIGIVGYLMYQSDLFDIKYFALLIALIVFAAIVHGVAPAIASILSLSIILFYKGGVHRIFDFLGEISYSVYLIHFPLGVKLLNLTIKYVAPSTYMVVFIITIILILGVSILFWKFIEKPFGNFSNRIRYTSKLEL
jgi:peptidoglycan/LPS O-acetylase OafA/YrhL